MRLSRSCVVKTTHPFAGPSGALRRLAMAANFFLRVFQDYVLKTMPYRGFVICRQQNSDNKLSRRCQIFSPVFEPMRYEGYLAKITGAPWVVLSVEAVVYFLVELTRSI